MSITKVQVVTSASSPVTIASTTAGNVLVVMATLFGRAGSNPSLSISASGVTFTRMNPNIVLIGDTNNASAHGMDVWFAYNIPSGVTAITITGSPNACDGAVVYELSGFTTSPSLHGESDSGQTSTSTSGNLTLPTSSTGANGDFGFVAFFGITSAGAAANSVSAIADANSNSWNGTSGVDTNVAETCRLAASWASLTSSVGNVTFTESGVAFKGALAFAVTP